MWKVVIEISGNEIVTALTKDGVTVARKTLARTSFGWQGTSKAVKFADDVKKAMGDDIDEVLDAFCDGDPMEMADAILDF